jgi:hypothetical protein
MNHTNGPSMADGPAETGGLELLLAEARSAYHSGAPELSRQLQRACQPQDSVIKENAMLINRIFAGRSLPARLALGTGLLALLAATVVLLPRTSAVAASEGFILSYDLADNPTADRAVELIRSAVAGIEQAGLPEGSAVNLRTEPALDAAGRPAGIKALIEATGDTELEAALTSAVGAIPGIPGADRAVGVWFGTGTKPLQQQGTHLTFTFKDTTTVFTFPLGTSAGAMEQAIGNWLTRNDPSNVYRVSVTLAADGTLAQMSMRFEPAAQQ